MLTKDEARELVVRTVCQRPDWLPAEDELVVFEEATIEKTWGWVFFYGSRLWHETHQIKYAIAGNVPVLVERNTGKLIPTGTARQTEHYIGRYEQTGDPNG